MRRKNEGSMSRLFKRILFIYAAVLCLMGLWASYSSYEKNRNEIYNKIDSSLLVLSKEYEMRKLLIIELAGLIHNLQ